jgi:cytochrome c oxidase subunit II
MRSDISRFFSSTGRIALRASVFVMATLASGAALAKAGMPVPAGIDLQDSVTEVADYIHWFHNWLVVLITVISVFVLGLLVYVAWRFNEKANPVPSKTTHHALLEVAWTVIPVLILVVVAIPSFRLLRMQLEIPQADMTLKVTGKQWYWSYDYAKDSGAISFDSLMLDEKDRALAISSGKIAAAEAPRQLAVDNEAVVPVGKIVKLQITAADVIHKFAVPSFGVKIDAIPGRLNETWFKAEKEGIYYGQCSFICGQNHAYMPIAFRVVSQEKYAAWLADAKKKFANAEDATRSVAAAQPAAAPAN